jgi:FkbM family methyltransferase
MSRKFERIEYRNLKFDCRPGTSDEKSVKEVVMRRGYARRGFPLPGPGQVWNDLGANIGAFSVWAASLGASVRCYEPDPASCEMVERNLHINGLTDRVVIKQVAVVADGRKKAVLHQNVARGNVWRNSIERGWRGETAIEVPCYDVRKLWTPKRYTKMDVEGSEMAILESVGVEVALQALVFEWSFDVDTSLVRYRSVISDLKLLYDNVGNATVPDDHDTWQPEWFPPCRTIFCWND